MQVTIRHGGSLAIHASPMDTRDFATNNPAGAWPASSLRGEGVTVYLSATGELEDYVGPDDVLAEELAAFIAYAATRGCSILTAAIDR
jgi:hypothetical protein